MTKKQDEMEKMFEDIGFEIIQAVRQTIEKNQSNIDKVSMHLKIPNSSLVIDIIIPQALAVMFMAGLIDDIGPEDFVYYVDSFVEKIKKDIFKIRSARLSNLNQED